jgi:radical SAM superfamily enzyme YgiQ (UPF0313 family)
MISVLQNSGVKTATIAPEAGSQRMRDVINKGLVERDILKAVQELVESRIPNLKLYFMLGLPTETDTDVDAIVRLCIKIKERFLEASRERRRIGNITVSLNAFVPKPATPFQWAAMDKVFMLKRKIKRVKNGLKRVANVRVHADGPRWAYVQALLSRGDRKVGELLRRAVQNDGNWATTLKESDLSPDFYVNRERSEEEIFPWDFIDHGVARDFLWHEYQKAIAGKISRPCELESNCKRCGVCQKYPHSRNH